MTALFGTLASPFDAAMGDLDGNGTVDFVFVHPTSPMNGYTPTTLAADVYLNSGTGSFGAPTSIAILPGVYGFSFSCGDVDQDGDADLVVHAAMPWGAAWVFPAAAGGFLPPLIPESVPVEAVLIPPLLADLDGDGRLDGVVQLTSANIFLPTTYAVVLTLVNDGSGRLRLGNVASSQTVSAVAPAPPFAFGDLDADGDGDYVGQQLGQPGIVVRLAQVGPPLAFPVPASIVAVTPATIAVPLAAFPSPVVKVLDASGAPVPNVQVTFMAISGATVISPIAPAPVFTGFDGTARLVSFYQPYQVAALAYGQAMVVASAPGAGSVTLTIDVMPLTLSVASGNFQTVPAGAWAPQPLTVVATDALGLPVPGVPIQFSHYIPPGSVALAANVGFAGYTDAMGQSSIACLCLNVGTGYVRACMGISCGPPYALFTVYVVSPYGLAALGGGGQAADLGEAFASPLSVLVTSSGGAPLVGIPVSWAASPPGAVSFQPSASVVSGPLGTASVVVTPASGGPITVYASVLGPTLPVAFSLFARSPSCSTLPSVGLPAAWQLDLSPAKRSRKGLRPIKTPRGQPSS